MKELAINAYKCKKCGKVHYPFHDRCLECRSREFEVIKPKGLAKLLTFTQIFNLPWGFDQRFLIIGVAEFENGVRAMGQIAVESIAECEVGMPVKAIWEPVRVQNGENVLGIKYHPVV